MLRNKLIANLIGKVWPSLLGLALVPVYLHYLGVEAYGLIGFFVALQALIGFLDLGLSTTTNREVALGLNAPGQKESIRDLVRTLELVYGLVALLIAFAFMLSTNWLAREWINVRELPLETVHWAVRVFGVTLALRWPVALYSGILLGSQKQVLYNALSVVMITVRGVGAALVVAFVSHTVLAYLAWQLIAALLELAVMAPAGWRSIHVGAYHTPRVKFSLLKPIWRFSASVGVNSLLAAIVKQMDRVLISRLLLLQQVGYYTTAYSAYSAIAMLTSPFATVAFPRFTSLIATKDQHGLVETYHKLSQYVSFVVMPVTSVLLFFSYDILLLWTRSEEVASQAALPLSILAFAAIFNSMMQIPFMLQLAAGITWISLWNNAINLIVLSPLMYFLISKYELAGAGIAWAIFNVFYYLITPHIMHQHILPKEKISWFLKDTLFFVLLGLFTFGCVYLLGHTNLVNLFIEIILGSLFYFGITLLFYPAIRMAVMDLILNNPMALKIRQFQIGRS